MPQVGSGHEPLKRLVPCFGDNRAELSPTSTVQIIYWVSKPTTNPFRDARWNFQTKERTQRNGSQFDKHIYFILRQARS